MTSASTPTPARGAASVLPGIALILLSRLLDGWLGGLLLGAGIALTLIGVFLISSDLRSRGTAGTQDGRGSSDWLPSRDGDGE